MRREALARNARRAVEIVLDELKKNPPQQFAKPPYPNYHKNDGLGSR